VILWAPKTSSASRDQPIFVRRATDASVSSDVVLLEIDRFGRRFRGAELPPIARTPDLK